MAVQQNRKTRAKRDMRRSHDKIKAATLSTDSTTGTKHRRHHIGNDGYYRGQTIIVEEVANKEEEEKE